jgi:hypothetical protein
MILDEKDEMSVEKTRELKTPLRLIRNEMKISEAKSLKEVQDSIKQAYTTLASLDGKKS